MGGLDFGSAGGHYCGTYASGSVSSQKKRVPIWVSWIY